MQVSVEAGEGLERRLTVALPAEQVNEEVQSRLQKLARSAKIAGFRPGKVPLRVVEQKFGKQVRGEVLGELMQSSFSAAVKQQNLRPASGPRIEPRTVDAGLEYVATFEVFPEFELAPVDGYTVERPVAQVTEQDIDNMLEVLRKQRMAWVAVDRPAQQGDRLTIDYEGTVLGQEQKQTAAGMKVVLGSKAMLPEFERQLSGSVAGEQREVQVQFPDDYPVQAVTGKPVRFAVTVHVVEEPRLPAIDEAFAASFGIKEGGIEALREEVRSNMRRELEQAVKERVKKQVMELLLKEHPIEVPRALVEREMRRVQQRLEQNMKAWGGPVERLQPAVIEEQARRRVALGLILGEFVRRYGMKPESTRVRETVQRIAATYEDPEAVTRWIYGNRDQLAEVESMAMEDQVVEWVLGHAQVHDIATSFNALLNRQSTSSEEASA
jgi:trigger factor